MNLTLSELYRSGVSGGVFMVALTLSNSQGLPSGLSHLGGGTVTVITLLAFLVGSVTYAIHRAVIYPLVYRALIYDLLEQPQDAPDPRSRPLSLSAAEARWDQARWADRRLGAFSRTAQLRPWADEIHLLYTSAWSAIAGVLADLFVRGGATLCAECAPAWWSVGVLAAAVVLAWIASISHRRYLEMEARLLFLPLRRSGTKAS